MVPAGNKAKRLSSVNHTTRTIHHHHKKELKGDTSVNTSNLAAIEGFIPFEAVVVKLDIDELVNVPGGLNDLKTEVDILDADRLEGVSIDLKKKITDAVHTKVAKKTKYDKLNSKVI